MNKDAGIWNAYKKKPFFNRQMKEFNSRMITGIETPNTNFSEDNIPNNEENCRQNDGRKNSFPSFYILHPVFETVQKWNQKGGNV